jgi:single-strand DNA-binding protein
MAGVNKVILVGRLGADPELKAISTGNSVARFSLATSENWVDKDGQRQERTEWHRIVVWGRLGELVARRLSKGKQAYVEGRLQTRSWEDNQGQKRYATEVVANSIQFLDAAGGAERGETFERENNNSNNSNNGSSHTVDQDFGPEPSFDDADEIPF